MVREICGGKSNGKKNNKKKPTEKQKFSVDLMYFNFT